MHRRTSVGNRPDGQSPIADQSAAGPDQPITAKLLGYTLPSAPEDEWWLIAKSRPSTVDTSPPQVADRRCQYCGDNAEIFDITGAWCTDEHRRFDRDSETTIRREWS